MGLSKKAKKLLLLAKKLRRKKHPIFLLGGIFFSWLLLTASTSSYLLAKGKSVAVLGTQALISPVVEITIYETPTPTLFPTFTPPPTPTLTPSPKPQPTSTPSPVVQNPQYTAQKINDTTWKVHNVANDDRMATPQEIFNALNSYRSSKGLSTLSWDGKLTDFAQERANKFASNGSLDAHAGFNDYMNNGGFDKSGFNGLGENSAYLSGPMNGDRIIHEIFGADPSHDGNQLEGWSHVGVGVKGNAVNVNFGKNRK